PAVQSCTTSVPSSLHTTYIKSARRTWARPHQARRRLSHVGGSRRPGHARDPLRVRLGQPAPPRSHPPSRPRPSNRLGGAALLTAPPRQPPRAVSSGVLGAGFERERERMVDEQIARRGITDARVLQAMRRVPRHRFVEEPLRDRAYGDHPLPNGVLGLADEARFDRILVAAGGPGVPPPLFEQLDEGGRMVLPLGDAEGQILTLVERVGGEMRTRAFGDCMFVPLVGKYAWES